MQTKLTLRLDRDLIRRAKAHARLSGRSVSSIVADLFTLLDDRQERESISLTPTVRSLLGALGGASVDENDYYRHLEDKHR